MAGLLALGIGAVIVTEFGIAGAASAVRLRGAARPTSLSRVILFAHAVLLTAVAAAASNPRPVPDEVRIFPSSSPEYLLLDIPESLRVAPDAVRRLVLFHGGVPVLDRGLVIDVQVATQPGGDASARIEDGYVEDAEVSPDGAFAIVLGTRYKKTLSAHDESETEGKTELTWIDPAHPRGLWSVPFDKGTWIKRVLLLSPRQGIAVSTVSDPDGPADLRLYGPEGI